MLGAERHPGVGVVVEEGEIRPPAQPHGVPRVEHDPHGGLEAPRPAADRTHRRRAPAQRAHQRPRLAASREAIEFPRSVLGFFLITHNMRIVNNNRAAWSLWKGLPPAAGVERRSGSLRFPPRSITDRPRRATPRASPAPEGGSVLRQGAQDIVSSTRERRKAPDHPPFERRRTMRAEPVTPLNDQSWMDGERTLSIQCK